MQAEHPLIFQGSVENPGINQRALKHLFSEIEERKDMWSYAVTVSSVEIYNEVLRYSMLYSSSDNLIYSYSTLFVFIVGVFFICIFRDLLSKDGEKLDIKINPDGTGQLHVPGLRIIEVKSFQHIKKVTHRVLNKTHFFTLRRKIMKLTVLVFVKILATARRNRITFGTQMNQHSSRSHALLCITVQGTDLATGSKTTGQSLMHFSFYGESVRKAPY